MNRLGRICSLLDGCTTFADVGCDHGYCTLYMLEKGLCDRAIFSDISAKSLNKAEKLLGGYIADGKAVPVCCDGLYRGERADQALIAGMGGEEIIKILKEGYIPEKFVFQPMKNAGLLREFLIENGCFLIYDDIFKDGKFYFIIKGVRRGERQNYTRAQLAFGRDSLKNKIFKDYLREEIAKIEGYLGGEMAERSRAELVERYNFMNGVYSDEIK